MIYSWGLSTRLCVQGQTRQTRGGAIQPVVSLIRIEYVLVDLMIIYNIKIERDAASKWLINTSDSWP